MSKVRIAHEGVDGAVEVEEISLPHYERSGWRRATGRKPAVKAPATKAARKAAPKRRQSASAAAEPAVPTGDGADESKGD